MARGKGDVVGIIIILGIGAFVVYDYLGHPKCKHWIPFFNMPPIATGCGDPMAPLVAAVTGAQNAVGNAVGGAGGVLDTLNKFFTAAGLATVTSGVMTALLRFFVRRNNNGNNTSTNNRGRGGGSAGGSASIFTSATRSPVVVVSGSINDAVNAVRKTVTPVAKSFGLGGSGAGSTSTGVRAVTTPLRSRAGGTGAAAAPARSTPARTRSVTTPALPNLASLLPRLPSSIPNPVAVMQNVLANWNKGVMDALSKIPILGPARIPAPKQQSFVSPASAISSARSSPMTGIGATLTNPVAVISKVLQPARQSFTLNQKPIVMPPPAPIAVVQKWLADWNKHMQELLKPIIGDGGRTRIIPPAQPSFVTAPVPSASRTPRTGTGASVSLTNPISIIDRILQPLREIITPRVPKNFTVGINETLGISSTTGQKASPQFGPPKPLPQFGPPKPPVLINLDTLFTPVKSVTVIGTVLADWWEPLLNACDIGTRAKLSLGAKDVVFAATMKMMVNGTTDDEKRLGSIMNRLTKVPRGSAEYKQLIDLAAKTGAKIFTNTTVFGKGDPNPWGPLGTLISGIVPTPPITVSPLP